MQKSRTLRLMVAMAFSVVSLVALAPVARADDSYTGTCSIAISPITVKPGQTVSITAKGFNASAEVTFTIDTPPVVIGTATANSSGEASINWVVPADFVLGKHVIQASGDGCSDPAEVSGEITVVSAVSDTNTTGTLPKTGGDYTNLLRIGILLVAAGGLVVLATRKRSSESTSA